MNISWNASDSPHHSSVKTTSMATMKKAPAHTPATRMLKRTTTSPMENDNAPVEEDDDDATEDAAYGDAGSEDNFSYAEEDSDGIEYRVYLQSTRSKETMNVTRSEEADMLVAMVKHANGGVYTIEDLMDTRKLRLGLLLLYQARIGQQTLIKSTSIHVHYGKLPELDSTQNKLGKSSGLDSELLVAGFPSSTAALKVPYAIITETGKIGSRVFIIFCDGAAIGITGSIELHACR